MDRRCCWVSMGLKSIQIQFQSFVVSLGQGRFVWTPNLKGNPAGSWGGPLGENDIKFASKCSTRVDPVLKLFNECPVMLTDNKNVKKGQANGTRVRVMKIQLKNGENSFELNVDGIRIPAAFASQVKLALLKHENETITPQMFTMKPAKFCAKRKIARETTHWC